MVGGGAPRGPPPPAMPGMEFMMEVWPPILLDNGMKRKAGAIESWRGRQETMEPRVQREGGRGELVQGSDALGTHGAVTRGHAWVTCLPNERLRDRERKWGWKQRNEEDVEQNEARPKINEAGEWKRGRRRPGQRREHKAGAKAICWCLPQRRKA